VIVTADREGVTSIESIRDGETREDRFLIYPDMCLATEENHRNTHFLCFTDNSDAH
jgi:hypothetical protein